MNWRYETRRYLYCREEGSFAALSIEARMLAGYILKYTDDKGRVFARPGEQVVDALMFRMHAHRGARRWLREAYQELIDDGYLVVVNATCVKVKNFAVAQAKPEAAPSSIEPVTNALRVGDEPAVIDPRPGDEPAATAPRTSNEECVKSADSFDCDPGLPSVPSGPSAPSPSDPPLALARDPGGGAGAGPPLRTIPTLTPFPPTAPLPPPPAEQAIAGAQLRTLYGRVYADVVGGKTEWQVGAGSAMWNRTEALSRTLAADDLPLLEPTMRTVLQAAMESQDPKDRDRHYAFGVWASRFPDLRDEALGLRKPVDQRAPARSAPARATAAPPVGHARPDLKATEAVGDQTSGLRG